jgi:hypothetical protein
MKNKVYNQNQTYMDVVTVSGLISFSLVFLFVFLPVSYLAFTKYSTVLKRAVCMVLNLFICLVIFYYGAAELLGAIGNLYPNMKGVNCALLSEDSCLKKSGCHLRPYFCSLGDNCPSYCSNLP